MDPSAIENITKTHKLMHRNCFRKYESIVAKQEELKSSLEKTATIINLPRRSCSDIDIDAGQKRACDVASLPNQSLPVQKKPKPLVIQESGTKKSITSVSWVIHGTCKLKDCR